MAQPSAFLARSATILGVLGYLAAGLLYFGAGLIVPRAWAIGFWAAWLLGLAALLAVARVRPLWTPAVPAVAVAAWVAVVSLGAWLVGWTA